MARWFIGRQAPDTKACEISPGDEMLLYKDRIIGENKNQIYVFSANKSQTNPRFEGGIDAIRGP